MMLREIFKPKKTSLTLHLPQEMVGKTVEVLTFEINERKTSVDKTRRLQEIEELTKHTLVDLSGFKFDRDRANDYTLG